MIDICTVVFEQELPILKIQAQSIHNHCRNIGIRNIYVVLNDYETLAEKIDPAWWGDLASSVLVVPRTTFSSTWVENGWVNLEGEVIWMFQKQAAKNAITNLTGVKGVTNGITLKSESKDTVEKEDITRALDRNWSINGHDIKVEVNQNNVKLTGKVHSIYQMEEAGRLAWNTPGVNHVENELAVL